LLRTNAGNPKNFFSLISTAGDYVISAKFLSDVHKKMQGKYPGSGDLVEMKMEPNKDIKIIGFKHDEVKIDVAKIIDKAKAYNFPSFWEDIVELLTSDDQVMMRSLVKGTNEWNRLEAHFNLTMAKAKIQSI
jgi:hypothetical protein